MKRLTSRCTSSVYSIFSAVTAIVALPVMLLLPRGRIRWRERFGDWQLREQRELLWFHGASLGELNGLAPVVRSVREGCPHLACLVTVTSPTALPLAAQLGDHARLLPIDSVFFLRRAVGALSIRAVVFAETELWPALTTVLEKRGIPAFIINGRISEYSFPWYLRARMFTAPVLRRFRLIQAADAASRERFVKLGARPEATVVSGNAKYDFTLFDPVPKSERGRKRSQNFGTARFVVTLGSLRPGEEAAWFPVMKELLEFRPDIAFVVAPRHCEKFEFFAVKLAENGIPFSRRTSSLSPTRVLLLDTIGELPAFYSLSDLAFIGATLCDIGGHNPLEPASLGCPVIFGPYTGNIAEPAADLLASGGGYLVKERCEIKDCILRLIDDPEELRRRGDAAAETADRFRGAVELIVNRLRPSLLDDKTERAAG